MTKKDYNYHDWAQFMVVSEAQRPKAHHFAAVMFETRAEKHVQNGRQHMIDTTMQQV